MNRLFPLAFFLLLLMACGSETSKETDQDNAAEATNEEAANNVLAETEKADGWSLLFDGESMDQWRLFNHDTLMGWAIQSGEMVALGEGGPDGHGADIITKEKFDNFDLSLEWKMSEGGNSGIFFNVVEGDQYEAVYHTGPEYQLIDDKGFPGDLLDSQHSGANYSMHAPTSITSNPVGEFNLSRIRVEDGHVTHWLNGEKVVEYDLWTTEWQALIDAGKWDDYPDYGKARSGHLALQDHGNKIWFKNIKIKRL